MVCLEGSSVELGDQSDALFLSARLWLIFRSLVAAVGLLPWQPAFYGNISPCYKSDSR